MMPTSDDLLEYSVVYTDRALNHMSPTFQQVMNDLSSTLKDVYAAASVALIPGGGTYAMEAVARQFARDSRVLVIRNGWFSFRWSQILESADLADSVDVVTAARISDERLAPFAPPAIDDVITAIEATEPAVVFAPHVETASGIILPDGYVAAVADAVHSVGGLLVIDCIASGTIWLDMADLGIDVLLSAPQKGWSGPPGCGLVMLSNQARTRVDDTESNSFALDLRTWAELMETYETGGHAYHATMPTEALRTFRDVMFETVAFGLDASRAAQWDLGREVRDMLSDRGFESVAAPGFGAPGVVVSYTDDPRIKSGAAFAAQGLQIAPGVPLRCGEPEDFSTFRVGLFGLDKLSHVGRTIDALTAAVDQVLASTTTAVTP